MSGKQKEGYVEMEKKLKDMGVELNELAIAMCDYIQTGQKTEQIVYLEDCIDLLQNGKENL